MRSSFVNATLSSLVLGFTLVVGVSGSAYAADPSVSADTSAGQSSSAAAGIPMPTPLQLNSTYTPPSMGGSDISSNHRGAHGDGNPNR